MYLVTAEEMRKMDQETIDSFGIPGRVLMENAGRGAFEMVVDLFPDLSSRRVCVLAGRGNNGGDGFVVARYLIQMGADTSIFLLSTREKLKGDALTNFSLLEKLIRETGRGTITQVPDLDAFKAHETTFIHQEIFVDAILGTGLSSDVRGFFKDVIQKMNRLARPIFSIDIPSGLNADTGRPMGCAVKARATATFAFAKIGHILFPGREYTGRLKIINIGIPPFIADRKAPMCRLMEEDKILSLFESRPMDSHKGSFGHLLVVAGSQGKTGAAALGANAAMASGAGLVTLAIPQSLNSCVEPQVTETMTHPLPDQGRGYLPAGAFDQIADLAAARNALAVGPGLGTHRETIRLVNKLIREIHLPMVVDADGLNALADDLEGLKKRKAPTILTPHPGEMARLTGLSTTAIQEDRTATAQDFARAHNVILVLKGAATIVALPDGTLHICPTGNPGMASGGMGDLLTGMAGAFLAQGMTPENAAMAAVFLHGRCGDILAREIAPSGFTASMMIPVIPRAVHGERP